MNNSEDKKWLYGKLKDNGLSISYEDFENTLSNEDDRKWYYDKANSLGLQVGTLDEFTNLFYGNNKDTASLTQSNNNGTQVGSAAQQVIDEYDASVRNDAQQQMINLIRQNNGNTNNQPSLSELVQTRQREQESNQPIISIAPQQNTKISRGVQATDAIPSYQPQIIKPLRYDSSQRDEEIELDKRFTPRPVQDESDIARNYNDRFALTQRGQQLYNEYGKKQEEIRNKYLKEFEQSPEYQEIVSGRYTTQEEVDAANNRINELFMQRYGSQIDNDLKPYSDAINDEMLARYGRRIEEDFNALGKKNTLSQLDDLKKDVEGIDSYIKKRVRSHSGTGTNAMNALMGSRQYMQLSAKDRQEAGAMDAAKRLIEESEEIINEAKKKGNTNFVAGLLRGLRDNAFDAEQWAFGLAEMADNAYLLDALQKSERGEKLSPAEEKLLEASSVNMIVNAYYSQDLGRGYKAGSTFAQSLPFMLEFVVNPISTSGSAIAKSLLKFGIKKFGKAAMKKGVSKAGARLLGDAAAAAGMTFTTGLPRVAAGTMERLALDYNYGFDDNGNLKVEKVGDTSIGSALARSAASTFLENQSEMVFNAFRGASPLLKKADEVLPDGINGMFDKIRNSRVGQLYRELKNNPTFKELAERTKFRGIGEEYMEEVYNNFANIPLGEMTFEEAVDLDKNIDTFLGLAPTSIAFSMIGLGSLARERYTNRRRMNQLLGQMNEEQQRKFDELRQMSKENGNADIAEFIKITLADETLTPEEKRAEIEYCYELAKQNAIDEVSEADTQDKIDAETQDIIANSDQQTQTYTECNRIITNDIGEIEQVPGYIVGYIGGQPLWKPEGADASVQPVALKEGEYDPASIQSAPTEQVIADTEQVIREEDAAAQDRETRYSPDIVPPAVGSTYTDGTYTYEIVQQDMNGGWLASTIVTDEKGKDKEVVVNVSDQQYYDYKQAEIDRNEQQQTNNLSENQPQNESRPSSGESNVSAQTVNAAEMQIQSLREAGATEEAVNATIESRVKEAKKAYDKAVKALNAPFKADIDVRQEIDARKKAVEEAKAAYDLWSQYAGQTEQVQQEEPAVQETQQEPVVQQEETVAQEQPEEVEQTETIPVDESGNMLYHRVPVDVTMNEIAKAGLDAEETDEFVAANKEEAAKRLKSVNAKKPKVSTNLAQYNEAKKAWEEEMADAQAQVDYWNNVEQAYVEIRKRPGDTTAEQIMSNTEPMNGEEFAAQMLATGQLPLLRESYMKETGASATEAKQMFGLFRSKEKGGMTIERAGEVLMLADLENGTNFFDQEDANAGRNAIIEVLSKVRTRRGLTNFIADNRRIMAEREREAEYNQYYNFTMNEFGMTPEEYEAYQEYLQQKNPYEGIDINELNAIFAEAAREYEQYLNSTNNERGTKETARRDIQQDTVNEQTGETGIRKEGTPVLPETQPVLQSEERTGISDGRPAEVSDGSNIEDGTAQESTPGSRVIPGESIFDAAERAIKEKEIADARAEVNTNPTEGQKEAGNYKKGHVTIDGLDITIENPKGSQRTGTDANGKQWSITMQNDYGYIRGTKAVDGDHIDIFLSDNPTTGNVFVVDAIDQETGEFDESKVMYGFESADAAREAYLSNYEEGWKVGIITEVSKEEFKKWIDSSTNKIKPFSYYKSVNEIGAQNESQVPQPNLLPQKLREAYEANNKQDIENAENNLKKFIDSSKDLIMLYSTYLHSKRLLNNKDILTDSGKKMHDFIVKSCKSALVNRGIPSQVFSNEKSRTGFAKDTDNKVALEVLAYDNSFDVLLAVINNKNTSDEILRNFVERFKNNGLDYEAKQELDKRNLLSDNKSVKEVGAQNEQRQLSIEEIENATVSDIFKDGAKAYINGNVNFATTIAYQTVYNNVRNQPRSNQSDSQRTSTTQLDGSTDVAGSRPVRPSGSETNQVDREGSRENVSGQGVRGEDSVYSPAVPDGERSNNEVRGEESTVDGLSTGRSNTGRSRKSGGDGNTVRAKRGRKSSKPADGENTKRRDNSKSERDIALDEISNLLDEFVKAGKEGLSLSVVGMNPKQIEIAGKILVAGVKLGYTYIKDGIYKFSDWSKAMREKLATPFSQSMKLTDAEIDEFIKDMWEYPHTIDGQTKLLKEWAAEMDKQELRDNVRMTLEEKQRLQQEAESIPVEVGNMQNIVETLPYLLPQQQEDVFKAERQFFDESHNDREHAFGKGYLFTNGTGTGKTYTGLGIVKRFIKQGKGRILILTPSQPKITDWVKDASNLGITLTPLESTQDKGEGAVITTFANLRTNKALMEDAFDLIVYDESHRIMENKQGEETIGAMQHYMLSNKNEQQALNRLEVNDPFFIDLKEKEARLGQLSDDIYYYEKKYNENNADTEAYAKAEELKEERERLNAEVLELRKRIPEEEDRLRPEAQEAVKRTKVVFLSATPFNTIPSLAYAEGYIFSYPEENKETVGRYTHRSPREEFLEKNFGAGYRFRYGRIENSVENPEALSRQEVQFSDYLENQLQTKSGRVIDSEYDYSRDFPTVTLNIAPLFNAALEDVFNYQNKEFYPLADAFRAIFYDYNYSTALFETMKIAAITPRIRQHLAMGRKVVIFHRRKASKYPITPPFATALMSAEQMAKDIIPNSEENKEKRNAILNAIKAFKTRYARLLEYEQTLDYAMPREQIAKTFGANNVLYFSGSESKKVKDKAIEQFNDDNSGKDIIVIQEASGKEGISLHDTTGNKQRVLITLALPQSPITALQIEGRIYRIGNKSNAIFEYPLLGLNLETTLFGQKFNQQVSTTENLALGSKARNLRTSFAEGVLQNSGDIPLEGQGVGGREFDNAGKEEQDGYDQAVLDYYGNQKLKGKRDQRTGIDYFPTPEPIGYKMVEWAQLQEGEDVLEPSAGHGAIARYVPRENGLTAIEPSRELFSTLQLRAGGTGRKFVDNMFEQYNIVNKHDVVLMNPPYGTAGATAMRHVAKAFDHLNEGGRLIAIIPRGATDNKFEKWLEETKSAAFVGEVLLPSVTFSRAGTSVSTRIVIVDKVTREDARKNLPRFVRHDLTFVDKIENDGGLFDVLRNIEMPRRTIDQTAIDIKNAKKTSKEIRDLKPINYVFIDENGVEISGKGAKYNETLSFVNLKRPAKYAEYVRAYERSLKNSGKQAEEYSMFLESILKTFRDVSQKTHEQLMNEYNSAKSATSQTVSSQQQESNANAHYSYKLDTNTATGAEMHLDVPSEQGSLSNEEYKAISAIARSNRGYWNRFKKAFHFPSKEDAEQFIQEEQSVVRFRESKLYNINNINEEIYKLSGIYLKEIYKAGQLGRVLKANGEINIDRAIIEAKSVNNTLSEFKNELTEMLPDCTDAAAEEVREMLSDIDYAIEYYNRLAKGEKAWNNMEFPRFRALERANNLTDTTEIVSSINALSSQLNTPIRIANSLDEVTNASARRAIESGRNIKAWFEPSTGEVVVYIPNAESVEDAKRSVLHEVVGHRGLRQLIGEDRYDKKMGRLYALLPDAARRKVAEQAALKYNFNIAVAMDEYLAEQAELDELPTWWDKVVAAVLDMLRSIGINVRLTNGDVRYLLWRSRKNLETGNIIDVAEDVAMRDKAGINENGIRFRQTVNYTPNKATEAQQEYDRKLSSQTYKAQEAFQDSMLSLKILQDLVEQESGRKIQSFENAYDAENRMSSISQREKEVYMRDFYKPLTKAVSDLVGKGASYTGVQEYVIAKHGLERNEVFARRDAEYAANEMYNAGKRDLDRALKNGTINQSEYDAKLQDLEDKKKELYNKEYEKNRKKDYSGLTQLTGEEKDYEQAAQEIVDEFESNYDTTELWQKINAATNDSLRKTYESGIISRDMYNQLKARFQYYVPLRGWKDTTTDEVYEYMVDSKVTINPVIKKAGGRKSLADDPFATIGNMAETAIQQGNRNIMKQHFLNMALNHESSLLSVQKAWYVLNDSNEWVLSTPNIVPGSTADEIADAVEAHEKRMKELEERGEATQVRSKLNVQYVIKNNQVKEHAVVVKRNGQEVVVFVNGNPRAAQAVNGLTNPNKKKHDYSRYWDQFNRFMSANFTTRNPAFVLTNLTRDLIFSATAVAIKENSSYNKRFRKNIVQSIAAIFRGVRGKEKLSKETDRYFQEFLANGGETGYTNINTVEEYKKRLKREIKQLNNKTDYFKGVRAVADFFSMYNRMAEDVARFNTYMTSRQEGRTIAEAIRDAKEITVNFNRRGAGYNAGGAWGAAAGVMRQAYLFFNAAVQSLANFSKLYKAGRKAFLTTLAGFTTAGFLVPMLNAFLMGDDDDNYYNNLPEWTRRNNICIYIGGGDFFTIPLPIELRAFYGLGELAYQATIGRDQYASKNVAYAALNQITELLPLNPLGHNGDIVTTVIPDAIKPFWYLNENETFTGSPIYKKNDFNTYDPEFKKAYRGTSTTLVNLSKWLNEMTGGNNAEKGWIDKIHIHNFYVNNPAQVEELFNGFFGGMSTTILQTATTMQALAESALEGEKSKDLTLRSTPVLNRFATSGGDDRSMYRNINNLYYNYYDIYKEVSRKITNYKKEIQIGNREYLDGLKEIMQSDDYITYQVYRSGMKDMRKINQAKGMLAEDAPELEELNKKDAELKKKIVDKVNELTEKIAESKY